MKKIAQAYAMQSDTQIDIIPGSSGKLTTQILNGAPFDLFFSADSARPVYLEQQGKTVPGSRFSYARGQLAIWYRDSTLTDIVPTSRVAIANPRIAPYGKAARQFLNRLRAARTHSRQQSNPTIITGESVAQAYQFVYTGAADIGIISMAQKNEVGRWQPIDLGQTDPIIQQAVIIKDSKVARDFMRFIGTEKALTIIRQFGYHIPHDD